ncbi:MAG: hypothetical protein KGY50_03945 [Candidatus Thermoplasmatota archaeon]|nr:hypothetical protein [Candidatus Thermoplasmatota archaeon]
MISDLKTVKAFSIIVIILFSSITISLINPESKVVDTAEAQLITFNSYMDFQYDTAPLSKPLEIDVSVSMQLTVRFWTDIPKVFGRIPFPLNNLILFGQSVGPMQRIRFEVLNPPDWANIYISSPDVLLDIPLDSPDSDEKYSYGTVTLIVSPKIEAPATSQKIQIEATCEQIGKLKGTSRQETIEFTPSFIPTVQINVEEPVRTVGPHESVNFNVNVKNEGNKITRITPDVVTNADDWNPTINPPQVEVAPNSDSTFTFSIVSPFEFGWHNEFKTFEIKIRSEVYPYRSAAANNTQSIYLTVNNLGFSTPGFEVLTLMVAIFGIAYIFKKKNKIN